jgi:hypothetical protein
MGLNDLFEPLLNGLGKHFIRAIRRPQNTSAPMRSAAPAAQRGLRVADGARTRNPLIHSYLWFS